MPKQKLEIECPVCDAKLSIDARSCPKCGADLGMADFQDLENLANDISGVPASSGTPIIEKKPTNETITGSTTPEEVVSTPKDEPKPENDGPKPQFDPSSQKESKEESKGDEEPDGKRKKKGLFSKFFGKKK